MQTRNLCLLLAMTVALPLGGCGNGKVMEAEVMPVAIVSQITGDEPAFKEMGHHVINSAEELAALGSAKLAEQEIDFSANSLIVVTVGEQPAAGFWVQITGIQQKGDDVFIQATVNQPDGGEAGDGSHAYAAAVTAKVSGNAILEPTSVTGQAAPN